MQSELDILRDVCDRLERNAVAYMLTGSMAMNCYAQPRMTRAIDFVLELQPGDFAKLAQAFEPDYYVPREALEQAVLTRGMCNLLHYESVVKVDWVVRKDTPYRKLEFERRARVALPDCSVWILSKEDLILSKLAWAKASDSELQRRDVRNLLSTSPDTAYLRQWAPELGAAELLEELLDERYQP